jgi:hypothetical protein
MKRKIIALMAVIPIILLFIVFSVSGAVSLAISIPVSSITIENKNDGVITLDHATYEGDHVLYIHVNPINAANRGFTKTLELIDADGGGGATAAEEVVSINSDGRIVLGNKIGRVKLTCTSNDGGYTDSVIIIATSSAVLNLQTRAVSIFDGSEIDSIESGQTFKMEADVYPQTALDTDVIWTSSDPNVISVNRVTGEATALTSGEATLTATSAAGLLPQLVSSQTVTVTKADTLSGITINGKDSHSHLVFASDDEFSFLLEMPDDFDLTASSDNAYIDAETDMSLEELSDGDGTKRLLVSFTPSGEAAPDSLDLTFSDSSLGVPYVLTLNFVDDIVFTAHTASGEVIEDSDNFIELSRRKNLTIKSLPKVGGLTYVWQSSNPAVIGLSPEDGGAVCKIISNNLEGESTVTVWAYLDGSPYQEVIRFNVVAKQSYTALVLSENAQTFGIAKRFAVGDKVFENGEYKAFDYKLKLYALNHVTSYNANQIDTQALEWTSSSPAVATVEERENDGHYLKIHSTGEVTLTVKWVDGEDFGRTVEESLTVQCVKDGVNIYDYAGLIKAAEDGRKIILQENIMLGKDLSGYSTEAAVAVLKSQVKKMETTADYSYYRDTQGIIPTVNYCVEFKNDVFGNGHFINAERITNHSDGSARLSDAVFNGPLNMVNLAGIASVKAQDNIVFLVRTDNVTINNVELLGANDVSDLTRLNKTGTVLEVISSGVRFINSRAKNGRTVVRFYGESYDADATAEQLKARQMRTLRIESSILSCAREFLLKIGTNAALKNDRAGYDWTLEGSDKNFDAFAPKFTDANNNAYEARLDANKNSAHFVENYVKTQVVLKNSVLATSGLFSVGVECKFAGPMLFGYSIAGVELDGWANIAGTSFASRLSLEGDVRFYDWKNLNNIDSSSLIELDSIISETNAAMDIFNLNIGQMVYDVAATHPEYNELILQRDAERYAHGGIAFFGGGLNYSVLDTGNFSGTPLTEVIIPMDINRTLQDLMPAAGNQPFRFFMYKNESPFNLAKQQTDLASGTAYSWIPPQNF